jgi:hypothetical protein
MYAPGGSRPRRRRPVRTWSLWLITASGCAAVAIVAYALVPAHPGRAADAANVSGAEGWGRGGYPMMPPPAGSGPLKNAAAAESENWAGYASTGSPGTFTSVSATWSQPAVTCGSEDTFSSFWVGLDGDGTNSVEQTGTEADCAGGTASYQGWFEMFPDAPVFYSNPVAPGDAMSASVVASGGGAFTLTLTDSTQGWTQTTDQTSDTAELGSAEVIAEAPSDGTVLPLSDFGAVNFANATVDGTAIGDENPSSITMVSAGGVTEATPSALTGDNAFTVSWDSSGGTPGASPSPSTSPSATPSPSASPSPTPTSTGGSGHHHHHHHHRYR